METGRLIKTYNSFYYVEIGDELVTCRSRGRFKRARLDITAGDIVEVERQADGTGVIEGRHDRRNCLFRPSVANIDQVILTFAAAEPDLHPLLLNRFLIMAEWSGIPEIVICINKCDLLPQGRVDSFLADYARLGYRLIKASARENWGIEQIKPLLTDKVTVFAGPSGVGKSSLLNAINPELELTTGHISEKIKRGRHTTRIAQLIPFAGGYIADTPGFSVMEFDSMDQFDLAGYFPEFRRFIGDCRFAPCSHTHEPDCGVKRAVEAGLITEERYNAYKDLYFELKEKRKEY